MLRLKLIPKLACFFSVPSLPRKVSSLECSQFRWVATSSQGGRRRGGEGASRGGRDGAVKGSGDRKNDDSDISSKQRQGVSNEQFLERFLHDDENRSAQRVSNREVRGQPCFQGPFNRAGLAGRASSGHENSAGRSSRVVRDLDRSEWVDNDDKTERYRSRQFTGHDEDTERLDELDNSDQSRRNRQGASYMKGRAVLDLSDKEDPDAEDETDEEELKAISNMDNEEFEKHLRHKENAKASKREYMAQGEKIYDKEGQKVEDVKPVTFSKVEMAKQWKQERTLDKLPKEYNVCKARVHSILWECEKRKLGLDKESSEEDNGDYVDSLVFDSDGEVCPPPTLGNNNKDTLLNTKRKHKIEPKDWEGSVRTEFMERTSAKEESMMLEEFERRMEYNRLQVAAFVKQHLYSRRRPVEGWNYIVDKFGSEGKIGKSDGKHGKLNELEKSTLKRDHSPRRKFL